MVSRILHNCGIPMGVDLLAGDELNADGYFEDEHFLEVNKNLLKHCEGGWANVPSLNCLKHQTGRYERMIKRALDRRNSENRHKSWGFKDPRTSLTCHVLHPYLPNPKYLVVRRNEADVVASLVKARPALDRDWSQLYADYYDSIARFLAEQSPDSCEVHYDLLTDTTLYVPEAKRLLEFVGAAESKIFDVVDIIKFRKN